MFIKITIICLVYISAVSGTKLISAIRSQNLDLVKELVKIENLNESYHNGNTPLKEAVKTENYDIVKVLIEANVDVNYNVRGKSPLMKACALERLDLVDLLLKNKADENRMYQGNNAFIASCYRAVFESAKYLLEHANPNVNAQDDSGCTCLHYAPGRGGVEFAKFLINEKNADVNIADKWGETALFRATSDLTGELARLILDKGGNPNACTYEPLHQTPLYGAVVRGNVAMIELLLRENIDVNHGFPYYSIMHVAAQYDNPDVVRILGKAGVPLDSEFGGCGRPLLISCYLLNAKVVQAFIQLGADIHSANNMVTPLTAFVAAMLHKGTLEHMEALTCLLDARADVNGHLATGESLLDLYQIKRKEENVNVFMCNQVLNALIDAGLNLKGDRLGIVFKSMLGYPPPEPVHKSFPQYFKIVASIAFEMNIWPEEKSAETLKIIENLGADTWCGIARQYYDSRTKKKYSLRYRNLVEEKLFDIHYRTLAPLFEATYLEYIPIDLIRSFWFEIINPGMRRKITKRGNSLEAFTILSDAGKFGFHISNEDFEPFVKDLLKELQPRQVHNEFTAV